MEKKTEFLVLRMSVNELGTVLEIAARKGLSKSDAIRYALRTTARALEVAEVVADPLLARRKEPVHASR